MTWHVHAAGSAEKVVDRLTKEAAQSHQTEQSRKIILGIRDTIETLAGADATRTLYVATEGHVDATGGRFSVSAEIIQP